MTCCFASAKRVFFAFDLLFLNREDREDCRSSSGKRGSRSCCAGNAHECSTSITSRRVTKSSCALNHKVAVSRLWHWLRERPVSECGRLCRRGSTGEGTVTVDVGG